MARLVLINGAPASGKSTLAQMYTDEHPMALNLDIDLLRSMLGRWLDQPQQAGLIARRMALEIAHVQLTDGRDLLVPQYLGRLDVIDELETLCQRTGAQFIELALLSDRPTAVATFIRRSLNPTSRTHHDAQALLNLTDGIEALPEMYDRLLEVIRGRPNPHMIRIVTGRPDLAYRELHNHVCSQNRSER